MTLTIYPTEREILWAIAMHLNRIASALEKISEEMKHK